MSKLRHASNYLRYAARAKTEHGVHSPFIYQFVTEVIYGATERISTQPIEKQRQHWLQSKETVEVTDYGAGSQVIKSNSRPIARMAKYAVKSKKYSELLYRIAQNSAPTAILELGTSLGITTSYLSMAAPQAAVHTVEGCENIAQLAQNTLHSVGTNNVTLHVGQFESCVPDLLKQLEPELVFFDGNHRYQPTIDYFEWALPYAKENSIFIFDDIHWSAEMHRAWKEIKQHPSVSFTLDLFALGLVFFRKDVAKQHLTIRY